MATASIFDYLRAQGLEGTGTLSDGQLSQDAYRAATGYSGQYDWQNPAYQAWVLGNPITQSIAKSYNDAAESNPSASGGLVNFLPNGQVYIPDRITAAAMDDGWGEGFGVLGKFAGLVGAGGFLNGAWGGLGSRLADAPWGVNPIGGVDNWDLFGAGNSAVNPFGATGGALPYSDGIEGLIDLTNKGLSGEQAIQTLSQINPQWTQSTLQFLSNNPSQIFGGVSGKDLLSVAGKLGATALGVYGSNKQADQLGALAGRYDAFGAPSRARYEAAMTPGFDPTTIPGYAGALDTANKSMLAQLSATGGNPFGNPGGLIDAQKKVVAGTALPAVQNYIGSNAAVGFGAPMGAALNLQTQGIGADANALNALGYGLNALTNPAPTYADLLKQLSSFKLNDGTGLT